MLLDVTTQATTLPFLPAGYRVRAVQLSDVPAITAMLNTWSNAVHGKDQFTEEDLTTDFTMPHFDLERSSRVIFAPNGEVAAVLEFWDIQDPLVKMWVWARVHPAHEGLGLGSYLMAWSEQRAEQARHLFPADTKVVLHFAAPAGHQPSEGLFRDCGLTPIRNFYTMLIEMDAAPDVPAIPEGFRLRPYQHPEDFPAVAHAIFEAFQDHWGHVENQNHEKFLEQWQHEIEADAEFDPSLFVVSEHIPSGEIAGASICRTKGYQDPDMGWVADLGVRRQYRKNGLASYLLRQSFGMFWERGQNRVGLGVDASNLTGALRLYQNAGMKIYSQRTVYEKTLQEGIDPIKS